MSDELWRPVAAYAGVYEVSSLGGVRSISRTDSAGRSLRGVARKPAVDPSGGYRYVSLSKNGIVRKVNVHILVLEAFVGPRPSAAHQGCHNDGNRADPSLENLRWDTAKGNAADRRKHGTSPRGRRGKPNAQLTSELIGWIKESPQSIVGIAAAIGIRHNTIERIKRNQTAALGGVRQLDQLKGMQ